MWLSSEGRTVSLVPPVLTPAERAASNGHGGSLPPPTAADSTQRIGLPQDSPAARTTSDEATPDEGH